VYEVGTRAQVRAFHVMPGLPPPEGERHAHDYRLDVVASRTELDDRGMVVDLDRLDQVLGAVTDRLADADLDEVIRDAAAVTVEVFARWLHAQLSAALDSARDISLAVRVWESPTAFGGYVGTVS
jgi:6-pyruvoyl-tetrahydropterin synthase